ncbi:MAG TPA: MerR family transcriptional regulator [Vicinamibacteria bacterium]|nr:MerR family transcriptional regulator [Vicinamibacteria bacterium]
MDNKQIPNKLFFKIGEVCEITDTQPYVLRYWESEFPALAPAKNSSGQRIYRRKDIETVLRIKQLLYEEGFTIAGAKKRLEAELGGRGPTPNAMASLPETVVTNVEPGSEPAEPPADAARAVLLEVRDHLRGILTLLDKGDRKNS